jgi:hypothetical protein
LHGQLSGITMSELAQQLEPFGADPESLRVFEREGPDLLPYATLLTARAAAHSDLTAVDGVYEWQDEPLMFLIDADRLGGDTERLKRIRRLLAMRGDAPYLGVAAPGRLDVYGIALDRSSLEEARVELAIPPAQKLATFLYLANERPGTAANKRWISDVVLKLLTSSIESLAPFAGAENAISLVGRALFTRFLADRNLLPRSRFADPATAFESAAQAVATCRWLDETFNGDFLPLAPRTIERLPSNAFIQLGNVLHRAVGGQLQLGWRERWDHLHFAHIPVGVLSEAYEQYLRKHQPEKQRKQGGYYTPRPVADLIVRAAFHAFGREHRLDKARVLDGAVGAGVFLLTAFRELVAERWRREGVRPGTHSLRQILYEQIRGFDSNEAALRFAALGLYLMSIELDPDPVPVRKLRFKNLRRSILYHVGVNDAAAEDDAGSLGAAIGAEHVGQYDIVVGNPPWTTGTRLKRWPTIRENVRRIARQRLDDDKVSPALPNEGLDLPFLWRGMEWARPDGQIALALHARLIFQQGDGMPTARRAIFQALDVSAIINGAELRGTRVWPNISAPFCLLFATNRSPAAGAGFRFVSPHLERPLNSTGVMRIDPSSAPMISRQEMIDCPPLLKIMFRGTQADLQIYERLRANGLPTFAEHWTRMFGRHRGRPQSAGNGYQKLRPSSRARNRGPDRLPGVPANYLIGLPELTPASMETLNIDGTRLHPFRLERIHDPRPRSLFLGPLLIVHQSPPATTARIKVGVSVDDVVFNETYYGYSAHDHADGQRLVRYLAVILSSKVALWLALMTSGKFGVERDVVEKTTIDRLLIPPFDHLGVADLAAVDEIFSAAAAAPDDEEAWDRVDMFAGLRYGLNASELQVIADTLRFNSPFSGSRRAAQQHASAAEVLTFCDVLEKELRPWGARYGRGGLRAIPESNVQFAPWRSVRIYFRMMLVPVPLIRAPIILALVGLPSSRPPIRCQLQK